MLYCFCFKGAKETIFPLFQKRSLIIFLSIFLIYFTSLANFLFVTPSGKTTLLHQKNH